jgi:hypothetical protein
MRPGWQLPLALAGSVALHAAVIGGPGWGLPDEFDGGAQPALAATLSAPAVASRPAAAEPHRSPRRTASRPKPAAQATPAGAESPATDPVAAAAAEPSADDAPTPEPVVVASAAESQPVPEARPVASDHGAVPAVVVPAHFRLQYRISLGGGFVIGRAMEEFSRNGRRYEFRSVMETTGIARLFKTIRMVYLSEGEVVAGGLRPHSFSIERDGNVTERAKFDWPANTVKLEPTERSFTLQPGAQDMLSMFCQLALQPVTGDGLVIPVVTRKRVEPYRFAMLGEQEVETGQGRMPAVHLRYKDPDGPATTDVWLAPGAGRLPVRIRLVDTKGDAYEQTAEVVEYREGEAL